MALRLSVGDAVLVYIDENRSAENTQIGVIKYIGFIEGCDKTKYVGIELIESIKNGHNGTINKYQYFDCCKGHGIHTRIRNVIRKLKPSEIVIKMQQIMTVYKSRLQQYVQALSERDAYIEKLKNKQRYLRGLSTESSFTSLNTFNLKAKIPRMSNRSTSQSFMLSPITLITPTKQSDSTPTRSYKLLQTMKSPQTQKSTDYDDDEKSNVDIFSYSETSKNRFFIHPNKWSDNVNDDVIDEVLNVYDDNSSFDENDDIEENGVDGNGSTKMAASKSHSPATNMNHQYKAFKKTQQQYAYNHNRMIPMQTMQIIQSNGDMILGINNYHNKNKQQIQKKLHSNFGSKSVGPSNTKNNRNIHQISQNYIPQYSVISNNADNCYKYYYV